MCVCLYDKTVFPRPISDFVQDSSNEDIGDKAEHVTSFPYVAPRLNLDPICYKF